MTTVRNATTADLVSIAGCHRKAFPHALSSAMGVKYLCKMLEWYLVDDRAFLFLLEEGGRCLGYCGGLKFDGTSRIGSASSMIQHSFRAAVKTFLTRPWLFVHPEFIPKYKLAFRNVYRKIRKVIGKESTSPAVRDASLPEPHAGLIVIGVDAGFHGRGYGSLLLKEFELRAKEFGFEKLHLTVRSDNDQAMKSYKRNGWVIEQVNGNSTAMHKYLKDV